MEIAIGIIVVWAIVHSYVDMQMKKRIEKLEKELQQHKHD